jgi:hypothetical protein
MIALPLMALLAVSASPAMAKKKGGSDHAKSHSSDHADKSKGSGKDSGPDDVSKALGTVNGLVGGGPR